MVKFVASTGLSVNTRLLKGLNFIIPYLVALLLLSTVMPCIAAATEGTELKNVGVKFEEKTQVGKTDLLLNGMGLRTVFLFKVYAVGLYLTEKKATAETVLSAGGAKRLHFVMLREITAEQLAEGLLNAMDKNDTEAERALLKPHIDEFRALILSLQVIPKGTIINLDYLPETGARFSLNGQTKGADIAGESFYRALLKIWLGPRPAQENLKNALLGIPQYKSKGGE